MKMGKFEMFVIAVIVAIFGIIVAGSAYNPVMNSPGATERRVTDNAKVWAKESNVKYSRLSCAYDSDNDGYGSCSLAKKSSEKITLQCPTGWWTNYTGARQCKELDSINKIMLR